MPGRHWFYSVFLAHYSLRGRHRARQAIRTAPNQLLLSTVARLSLVGRSPSNTSDKLTGLAASGLLLELGVDARTLPRSLLPPPGLVCFIGLFNGI